jgi:uncharacterized membrane protein
MRVRLDHAVSRLLLVGLSLAILLMVAGAVLAGAGVDTPVGHESSISDLPRALAGLEPGSFFDLGLLVLLATPIVRMVALLVGFARQRAWLFSGISLAVLVLLALSAFLGLRGG